MPTQKQTSLLGRGDPKIAARGRTLAAPVVPGGLPLWRGGSPRALPLFGGTSEEVEGSGALSSQDPGSCLLTEAGVPLRRGTPNEDGGLTSSSVLTLIVLPYVKAAEAVAGS